MAQIIKHRRGSITGIKNVTARLGELVVATGSVGAMNGPWTFIGSDEIQGGYTPMGKIYEGATAPTVAAGSYGTTLNGTPFYSTNDETLYILSSAGNNAMDLTGNIEGNVISAVTINNLTNTNASISNFTGGTVTITGNTTAGGTLGVSGATTLGSTLVVSSNTTVCGTLNVTGATSMASTLDVTSDTTIGGDVSVTGDITGSNLELTGNANIAGNVVIGGNITIGDATTDSVKFDADISSSFVPDANNTYDLGSASKAWRDIYIAGTASIDTLDVGVITATTVQFTSIELPGTLSVSGNTNIGDDDSDTHVFLGSVEFQGTGGVEIQGLLTGSSAEFGGPVTASAFTGSFVGDGSALTGIVSTLTIHTDDGASQGTGSISLKTETLNFVGSDANGLTVGFNDTSNTVTYGLAQDITTDAEPTFAQLNLTNAGTATNDAVRADRALVVTGTTNQVSVVGGSQTLQGDRTWTVSLPSTVHLGANSTLTATTVNSTNGTIGALSGSSLNFDTAELSTSLTVPTISGVTGITTDDIVVNGTATINNLTINSVTSDIIAPNLTGGTVTITGNTQMDGNLTISGNLTMLGSATSLDISSSTVNLDDNIIRLNAFSPFERYAGFEVIDSGSVGVSASLVWDSQNDYWMFVSSSGDSSKLIGTTAGTYGSETSLTINTIPKGTGANTIGDSLLTDDGITLAYNTNVFTVDGTSGDTKIIGVLTLSNQGGTDNNSNSSAILFRNSADQIGYVSTVESTEVMDGILGYKASNGGLTFSTVIDGGTY